jgi:bifunctional non-homologous end joining protein LigD
MLLTAVDRPIEKPGWFFEIKFDGFRCQAYGDEKAFVSRRGRDLTRRFPELTPVADYFASEGAVVDGEVVAFVDGVPNFSAIQGRKTRVVYVAFDLLAIAGEDLTARPLRERRALLEGFITDTDRMILSRTFPSAIELFEEASARGLEGITMKDPETPYVPSPKRTRHWLKVKTAEGRRQEKIRGETWGHKKTG